MKKRYLITLIVLFLFNVKNIYAEGKMSYLEQGNDNKGHIMNINCTQTSPNWPACQNQPNGNQGNSSGGYKDPADPSNKDTHDDGAQSGPEHCTPGASGNCHNQPSGGYDMDLDGKELDECAKGECIKCNYLFKNQANAMVGDLNITVQIAKNNDNYLIDSLFGVNHLSGDKIKMNKYTLFYSSDNLSTAQLISNIKTSYNKDKSCPTLYFFKKSTDGTNWYTFTDYDEGVKAGYLIYQSSKNGNNSGIKAVGQEEGESVLGPDIIFDCDYLFGDEGGKEVASLLGTVVNIIQIAAPLLLIGLGTMDFAKAVFSGSEEDMKKAQKKFFKRIIIAISIFLIKPILKILLSVAHNVWGDIFSADFCGILK